MIAGVAQQVGLSSGPGGAPTGLATEPPVQRGAARVMYGSGPLRSIPLPPTAPTTRIHEIPQVHPLPIPGGIDYYPPGYEVAHARNGIRLPNGAIAPYGVGFPGAPNGWMGRDGYNGRGDHIIIPGVGRNLNPGFNPIHRQDLSHGMSNSRIPAIGRIVEKPLDEKISGIIHDEDDLAEDGLGTGDDDCRPACMLGEFECVSSCSCIKMEQRCDGDRDCANGEDEADCRPSPARAPCLESAGRLRCPQSPLCISKDWLCDGDDDCGDFSDETHCGESFILTNYSNHSNKFVFDHATRFYI